MNLRLIHNYARSLIFKHPLYCLMQVTNRCNFRCRMCCSLLHDGDKQQELDIDQIKDVAATLKTLKVSIINIGGGEPLIRNDINEILSIFRKDFDLRMQTNAFLASEDSIKELAQSGLRSVSVSLDTLDPNKFDFLCNSKDGWKKVTDNMHLFSRYLPKRGGLLIMNTVVTKENILELPDLVRFSNSLGYYSAFIPVHLSDNPNNTNIRDGYAPELDFTGEDISTIQQVYDEVISMKKQGYKVFNSYKFLKGSPQFLVNNVVPWKCDARLFFLIHPNGDISTCHPFEPIGNILDSKTLNTLQQPEVIRNIEELSRECSGCMHPCWAETSQLAHDPFVFQEKAIDVIKTTLSRRQIRKFD